MKIETRSEGRRGCGYRSPGLYLVGGGLGEPCGKLPLPLTICPTCGGGIKPTRGWTWVNATALFDAVPCQAKPKQCRTCPIHYGLDRAGLLWIGVAYYATPADFSREADTMGVCRRLAAIPKGLKVGPDGTWVLLAHRRAIHDDDGTAEGRNVAGIFHTFLPKAIEYVVKDDDSEEKLERLQRRGVVLVRVERAPEPAPLFDDPKPAAKAGKQTRRRDQGRRNKE